MNKEKELVKDFSKNLIHRMVERDSAEWPPIMKKRFSLLLMTICIITAVCGCARSHSTTFPDFQLPKDFHLQAKDESAYSLVNGEQTVGEIVKTTLSTDVLSTPDCEDVIAYLETYVSEGMQYEYMMGYGEDNGPVEIGLNILDPTTLAGHEYTHYLFEKNGECYDLWVDPELVDAAAVCDILITTGIDPSAELA